MEQFLIKAVLVFLKVLSSEQVLPALKKVISDLFSETITTAPLKGIQDEIFEKKIIDSGMLDVPLPDNWVQHK